MINPQQILTTNDLPSIGNTNTTPTTVADKPTITTTTTTPTITTTNTITTTTLEENKNEKIPNSFKIFFKYFDNELLDEQSMVIEFNKIENKLINLYEYYSEPMKASEDQIKSGKLKIKGEEIEIPENIKEFTLKLSGILKLDQVITFMLIKNFGLLEKSKNLKDIDLQSYIEQLFTEYYQERIYLIEILGSVIRKSVLPSSKYYKLASKFFKANSTSIESKLLSYLSPPLSINHRYSTLPHNLLYPFKLFQSKEQVVISESLFSIIYCIHNNDTNSLANSPISYQSMLKLLLNQKFGSYTQDTDYERKRLISQCEFNLIFSLLILLNEKWSNVDCEEILQLIGKFKDLAPKSEFISFLVTITVINLANYEFKTTELQEILKFVTNPYLYISSILEFEFPKNHPLMDGYYSALGIFFDKYFKISQQNDDILDAIATYCPFLVKSNSYFSIEFWKQRNQISLYQQCKSLFQNENQVPILLLKLFKSLCVKDEPELIVSIFHETLQMVIESQTRTIPESDFERIKDQNYGNGYLFKSKYPNVCYTSQYKIVVKKPNSNMVYIKYNLMDFMFDEVIKFASSPQTYLHANSEELIEIILCIFSRFVNAFSSDPSNGNSNYLFVLFQNNQVFEMLLNCYLYIFHLSGIPNLQLVSYILDIFSSFSKLFPIEMVDFIISKGIWINHPLSLISQFKKGSLTNLYDLERLKYSNNLQAKLNISQLIIQKNNSNHLKLLNQQEQFINTKIINNLFLNFQEIILNNRFWENLNIDTSSYLESFLLFQHQIFTDFMMLDNNTYLRDIVIQMIQGFIKILEYFFEQSPSNNNDTTTSSLLENFIFSMLNQFFVQIIENLFNFLLLDSDQEMIQESLSFLHLSLKYLLFQKNYSEMSKILQMFFLNNSNGVNLYQLLYQRISTQDETEQKKLLKILLLLDNLIHKSKFTLSLSYLPEEVLISLLVQKNDSEKIKVLKYRYLGDLIVLGQFELVNRILSIHNEQILVNLTTSVIEKEDSPCSAIAFQVFEKIFHNLASMNQDFLSLIYVNSKIWDRVIDIHQIIKDKLEVKSTPQFYTTLKKSSSLSILSMVLLHDLPPISNFQGDNTFKKSLEQLIREYFKFNTNNLNNNNNNSNNNNPNNNNNKLPKKLSYFKFMVTKELIRLPIGQDKFKIINQYCNFCLSKSFGKFLNIGLIKHTELLVKKHDKLLNIQNIVLEIASTPFTVLHSEEQSPYTKSQSKSQLQPGQQIQSNLDKTSPNFQKFLKYLCLTSSTIFAQIAVTTQDEFDQYLGSLLSILNFYFRLEITHQYNNELIKIFKLLVSNLLFIFSQIEDHTKKPVSLNMYQFNQCVYSIGIILSNERSQFPTILIDNSKGLLQTIISHVATRVSLSACLLPQSCFQGLVTQFEIAYSQRSIESIIATLNLFISFTEQPLIIESLISCGALGNISKCLTSNQDINYFDPFIPSSEDSLREDENPWFKIWSLIIKFISSCSFAFAVNDKYHLEFAVFIIANKEKLFNATFHFIESNGRSCQSKESLEIIENILRMFSIFSKWTLKYYSDQSSLFNELLSHVYRVLVVIIVLVDSHGSQLVTLFPPKTRTEKLDNQIEVKELNISLYNFQINHTILSIINYCLDIIHNTFPFIKENQEFIPRIELYTNIASLATFNSINVHFGNKFGYYFPSHSPSNSQPSKTSETYSQTVSLKTILNVETFKKRFIQMIEKNSILLYYFINYYHVKEIEPIINNISTLKNSLYKSNTPTNPITSSPNLKSISVKPASPEIIPQDLLSYIVAIYNANK